MRIAQLAPPFESVPPRRYGGTERVVSTLTEELVRRGHEVTLFAPGDSHTAARLVPTVGRALWHQSVRYVDVGPFLEIAVGRMLRELGDFDVVHSHIDYWGLPLARAAGCPVMTTLHGRLDFPELAPLYAEFADAPLISISDAQRRPLPHANWIATVHHGIDLDQFTPNLRPGRYLAFLGRVSPEKGLDVAIRVARRTGLPLRIAARPPQPLTDDSTFRTDRAYFEEVIQPLLREHGVEMVGEVCGRQKNQFLRNAAALLFPICWPEPFGLVMAEALAAGTPVLALRHGSVPEVIRDGVTGFVCDDEDGLVRAVGRIGDLDRSACRAEAERRFSPTAMADQYEHVYAQLLARQPVSPPLRLLETAGSYAIRWRQTSMMGDRSPGTTVRTAQ